MPTHNNMYMYMRVPCSSSCPHAYVHACTCAHVYISRRTCTGAPKCLHVHAYIKHSDVWSPPFCEDFFHVPNRHQRLQAPQVQQRVVWSSGLAELQESETTVHTSRRKTARTKCMWIHSDACVPQTPKSPPNTNIPKVPNIRAIWKLPSRFWWASGF